MLKNDTNNNICIKMEREKVTRSHRNCNGSYYYSSPITDLKGVIDTNILSVHRKREDVGRKKESDS
jgi:hypothetical protein